MELNENIKAITNFLFIEDDLKSIRLSDLVIVLCNQNIEGLAKSIEKLFVNNKLAENAKIILTGANGKLDADEEKECFRLRDKLVSKYKYDEKIFILEDKATNIYENLLFSKECVNSLNSYQNIILIGAAFALRRVKLCATELGYPLNKLQYMGTVDDRNISKDEWWKSETAKVRVYEEIERIGKYLVKGDLDIE